MADEDAGNSTEPGTDSFELKLVDLRSLDDRVIFGPRKVMPPISWRHGRKSIFVATEALGGNGSTSGSSLIEVSLTGERKRVLVDPTRSEEHTSELQSLMRISYAVFCLKKKTHYNKSP